MILIILFVVVFIAFLAIIAMPSVKLHNNYKQVTKITLPLIIIGFLFFLVKIIIAPINFEKETNYRYDFIKEKLIEIRSAQLAYKQKYGQFTSSFDQLINFVKTDSFVLVQKTDTLVEYYNTIYREIQFKDTMLIDTLGTVSVLDSLFKKGYAIDSLAYVPPINELQFELRAGVINKSKIDVPVFEARDPDPYDKRRTLMIGSMTEANLNGNWQ